MKKVLATLAVVAVLGVVAAFGFVYSGLYDISATDQHLPPTYWVMQKTMEHSVEFRADEIEVPPLGAPQQLALGFGLYRAHCQQCHGGPGIAPEPFALGMTPVPVPLVHTGRMWTPGKIYWVVKEGIKMTGMPAWRFRMTEEEIWAVVAAVLKLPYFTPTQYQALQTPAVKTEPVVAAEGAPDPRRGKTALQQYACASCHQIPGLTGPEAPVGPPLNHMASREILAGVIPNTPENMVRWIRAPQEITPLTAMPDLKVTERDAVDMAAYLFTLK
jgi:mono/diheme cytochrome c family protein